MNLILSRHTNPDTKIVRLFNDYLEGAGGWSVYSGSPEDLLAFLGQQERYGLAIELHCA